MILTIHSHKLTIEIIVDQKLKKVTSKKGSYF